MNVNGAAASDRPSAIQGDPAILQDGANSLEDGIRFFRSSEWQKAIDCWERAAAALPANAQLQNYRARAYEALENHEDALRCIDQALQIDPSNAADWRNRGIVLRKLGRSAEALAAFENAATLRPNDRDNLINRAFVLNELDRRDEACALIDRGLLSSPDDLELLNARVIILDNLGRYDEALVDVDRLLGLKPNHLDAINNTGMLLARIGRFKEALTCYNRSLSLEPNQPQARYNRSLIQLSLGDWISGFKEFETRWQTAPLKRARLSGLGPLWLGQGDLNRRTILLYHEQGYGDTLQSVRYISLLAQRGARVILAVPPALRTLLQTVPGVTRVISGGDPLPAHDLNCPLMSLPLAFRTTPDTIPAPIPYVAADPALVERWRARLGPWTKPRIGIVWGGRRYAPINYPRDIPLEALKPLLELPADFIALQKDVTEVDQRVLMALPQVRSLGEMLNDFADTAALMSELDLIVTVDTAIVHLAGALGKPVWLLNRYASCWRWLQRGSESAWYPTLRMFRQPAVGDWGTVVGLAREALGTLLNTWPSSSEQSTEHCVSARRTLPWLPPRVHKEKIRLVCATRHSRDKFFSTAPLGRSILLYRHFPKLQTIELRLFPENSEGLPTIYNCAIEEAKADPAILVFVHDDVYLSDFYWSEHLQKALVSFDVVGIAGNRRRVPRQASWMYLDEQFTSDNYDNLSGVLGHGDPFPALRQLSVYGEPGQEVKLLDGVLMGVHSRALIERGLRFDPRFDFHFYDLDFCRQVELHKLRMGTWPISIVHASAGQLGGESWRKAYREYLLKYGE